MTRKAERCQCANGGRAIWEQCRWQTWFASSANGATVATRSRALIVGALASLALLVAGELAPALAPVWVAIERRGTNVVVSVDGVRREFETPADREWDRVAFRQPGPLEREYQVDGSDLTSRQDRNPGHIRAIQGSPLYSVAAWLRDEDSYSRWEHVRVVDLESGAVLAEGRGAAETLTSMPHAFRLEAALRRPEAAAAVWLVSDTPQVRNGIEINRDAHQVQWLFGPEGDDRGDKWFFPNLWQPTAASLLHLLGRTAAAAFLILIGAGALGLALNPVRLKLRRPPARAIAAVLLAGWLGVAAWVTVRLYGQLPHIIDATAYYLQMNIFRSGQLSFEAPEPPQIFRTYHQVLTPDERWFAQYPPGAPLAYAVGAVVGLQWLIGPLAGVAMLGAIALAGRFLYGKSVGLLALGLGVLSPFILFQAGAFMSHAIAGACLAGALAACAYADYSGRRSWYIAAGALLGWAFLTREIAALAFGLPLGAWLVLQRRWSGVGLLVAAGTPFVLAYMAYNAAVTGSPFVLPRTLYDETDRLGFGEVGLNGHTLAAGLVNVDENLTLLQFDLLGWPPLFALALVVAPFVLGQTRRRDLLAVGGVLAAVAANVAYHYDGIVLGPRYFYEALPWLLLLAARGGQAVAYTLQGLSTPRWAARAAVLGVVGLLSINTVVYYVPQLVERRTNYFGINRDRGLGLPFVETTFFGPRVTGFTQPSLVVVVDETIFKTLFALNCPNLDRRSVQECPVLFVRSGLGEVPDILEIYPGRVVFVAEVGNGVIELEPYVPEED